MGWQPIGRRELEELLAVELLTLAEDVGEAWNRFGLPAPVHVSCLRPALDGSPAGPEPIFCVARSGDRVLVYDDVEEDFGLGVLEEDGVLRRWQLYDGALSEALRDLKRAARN